MPLEKNGFEKGYSIFNEDGDTETCKLTGTGTPGGDTGEQDDAPISSRYIDLSTGEMYVKFTDTNATSDWIRVEPFYKINTTDAIQADQSGDARGTDAVDNQRNRSAAAQVASGTRAGIFTGQNNTASATDSCVVTGSGNTVSGGRSTVTAGAGNSITSADSLVGSGSSNTIGSAGSFNTIVGGVFNSIPDGTANFIGNGQTCSIAEGFFNIIVGGFNNDINAVTGSGVHFIGNGSGNQIDDGQLNSIVTGFSNTIDAQFGQILHGASNSITGSLSSGQDLGMQIFMGSSCSLTNASFATIINGASNTSDQDGITILNGQNITADSVGQVSFNGGSFGVAQSAQANDYTLIQNTTDGTTTRMDIESTNNSQIQIAADTTMCMEVHIVAMQKQTQGSDSACFVRRVLIENRGGTTALVGSVQTIGTDIGNNAGAPPAGWAVAISADNTNDELQIDVTGAASHDVRWVARVQAVQVGHA